MKNQLVLVAILLATASLNGQTFRGGIQGTITDSTGAAVAVAEVIAKSPATALTRSTQTDDSGNYQLSELPLGDYDLTVKHAGFKTQTVKTVHVEVSSNQRVNLQLVPGQVEQSVEVTAAAPLIESSGTSVGGTIEARQMSELPINGRDFIKILGLVPGSTSDASAVSDSAGSFGQFSINGNRGRSNNYLLDGTDINDGYRNDSAINEAGVFGTPATLLPVDALQEVAILSGTEAEYGRNSGAIVNVVTKSGTNTFHGSGFEFFRNNALDARNYFNTKANAQSVFHNNQFGGALGGPILKGSTFFYVAYEGQREKVGIPTIATIPSQADINAFTAGGGVINPVIQKLLALHPFTNGAALPATNGSVTLNANGSNRLDSFIGKIDQHFGAADVLTGRYFFGDSDQSFPLGLVGGSAVPGYNTVTPTRVQVLSLSYTHVISPKWLLELRAGYNRFFETFFPQDQAFDPGSIGLATTGNARDFGLPLISISGFSAIGSNAGNPRGRVDTNWQYFVNASHNAGKHNYKFGYEFRRSFVNQFFDANHRGKLSFASLDDFLMGSPGGGSQTTGDTQRGTFQNNHGAYFQDNFKATQRLTLNYGVRYDYFGVLQEKKNRLSILDPNPKTGGLVFVGSPSLQQLYPKDLNNFSPRIGFAYDLFGDAKTILRGGYGIAYDAFSQDFFAGQLPFNTSNAGPAFNGGGSSPVLFGSAVAGTTNGGPYNLGGGPVYTGFAASDVFTVDQKIRTPYVQNYSVNVQQQFTAHAAMQIGYVGSAGRKLFRFRDINQFDPALGARPFDNGPFTPAGGQFGYVNQFESTTNSNYNSLQTSLNVRDWHGFSSTVNYTWAHSIDTASDGQDFVANAAQPDNSRNPGAEKGNSNFDVRNAFKWFYNYNLPTTSNQFTSGWGMDGVLNISSGQPYSLTYQFENDFNGSGEFVGRPDVVGNPFAGTSAPFALLNLSAFQAPCTPDGAGGCSGGQHFGNLRRNAFTGPSYRNFDFAIFKNTNLGERMKMQFRADFFNIFNHPNFSNPVLPSFAVDFLANGIDPVTNRGTGFLQTTATPDVGIGNPFLGGGGPRNIQLAVKFTF